jgi:hypothetical protein
MTDIDQYAQDLYDWTNQGQLGFQFWIKVRVLCELTDGAIRRSYQGQVTSIKHFLGRQHQLLIASAGRLTFAEGADVDAGFNWVNQADDANHEIGGVLYPEDNAGQPFGRIYNGALLRSGDQLYGEGTDELVWRITFVKMKSPLRM